MQLQAISRYALTTPTLGKQEVGIKMHRPSHVIWCIRPCGSKVVVGTRQQASAILPSASMYFIL